MSFLYFLEHLSVAFGAIAGVLAGRGKRVDLFGILVLGMVTATGGGTLRDLILDVPVFWLKDPNFVYTVVVASCLMFVTARYRKTPLKLLIFADAAGLAFVAIVGTSKTLSLGHAGIICIVMGVTSGVAGGIIRDVLCSEFPSIFRIDFYWYATAAFCGACCYLTLHLVQGPNPVNLIVSSALILILRLAALRYRWRLPEFRTHEDTHTVSEDKLPPVA
ncbi:protein of unknown function UPF0126 [Planctopirus limnophila DSM 3776]|uniref:Glycine transporter domain-containing protein n=1 Tax=Planctopirus limnophila (strain ATCC 43296 / DSM 3776 / IFAM 1008 / Mu 290) TaxID=521674 RepID=D5SYX4_PLAL2|nr:trimeric intracellular cation channel family protein [Planctopirus limnophila]ADG67906.1 protein of unknown function UPF0126 [Planctopirus limnophila DSM 3776]